MRRADLHQQAAELLAIRQLVQDRDLATAIIVSCSGQSPRPGCWNTDSPER